MNVVLDKVPFCVIVLVTVRQGSGVHSVVLWIRTSPHSGVNMLNEVVRDVRDVRVVDVRVVGVRVVGWLVSKGVPVDEVRADDVRVDVARVVDVRVVEARVAVLRVVVLRVVVLRVVDVLFDRVRVDDVRVEVEAVEDMRVDVDRVADARVVEGGVCEALRILVPLRVTVSTNSVTVIVVKSGEKVARGLVMVIAIGIESK